MHRPTTTPRRQGGLSLVEIMVALVIGLVLMTGVVQVFIASKQSYAMNDGLARLQENGRFAISRLQHELRMAGPQSSLPLDPKALTVHLPIGVDQLEVLTTDIIVGSDGADADNKTADGNTVSADGFSLASFPSERDTDSDAVTFVGVRPLAGGPNNDCQIRETDNEGSQTTVVLHEASTGDCPTIPQEQLLLLTDYVNGDLFRRNNNPGSGNLTINIQEGGWSNSEKIDYDRYFQADADSPVLLGLVQTQYYVADSDACGSKALYKREIALDLDTNTGELEATGDPDGEALVCGVRTVQFLYGHSETGKETVARYESARTLDFTDANVLGLRMTLLLQGEEQVGGINKRSTISFIDGIQPGGDTTMTKWPYSSDGDSNAAVPANRMSKVFSTVIGLRNKQKVI